MRYLYRPGHPKASALGFVSEADLGGYEEDKQAVNSPFMVDRYMEGVHAVDGADIGSRRKRKEYMKQNDLADYDDFAGVREKAAKERAAYYERGGTEKDQKERKEALAQSYRDLKEGRIKHVRRVDLPE